MNIKIFLALLGLILLIKFPINIKTYRPPITETFSNLKNTLKTGDLIFFRATKHENLHDLIAYELRTTCINAPWGHVGLVYKPNDNSEPLLLEFRHKHDTAFTQFLQPGQECQIVELEYFLKNYQESYNAYFGLRRISTPIDNKTLYKHFQQCRNHVFRPFWKIILFAISPKCFHPHCHFDDGEMYCSEFIAHLLMKCDVFKCNNHAHLYFPWHFDEDYDYITLTNNYNYSKTIVFGV